MGGKISQTRHRRETILIAKKFGSFSPKPVVTWKTVAIYLAVLLTLAIPAAGVYAWESGRIETEARQEVDDQIAPYQHSLISQLEQRRGHLHGLTAFAEASAEPGELEKEFDIFARGLVADEPGLRAVEIAPGGVIKYLYPLEGNEAALGADLINDPRAAIRRDVKEGIATGKTILGGPYKLLQGGQGFVAREPIYNPDGSFWAMSQLVFNIDNMLSDAGLNDDDLPFNLTLRMGGGEIIYGDAGVFKQQPVLKKIEIMNKSITMAAIPKDGWDAAAAPRLRMTLFNTSAITILLAFIISGALDRQRYLKAMVSEKTGELEHSNAMLMRSDRMNKLHTAIDEIIIHAADEASLYDSVCQTVVNVGGFKMCWLGLVDDADQSILPVAMAGAVDGYLDEIKITVKDIPEGRGPTGTAIREDRTYIITDIANNPVMAPWREQALKRGLRASGAFPIRADGSPIGALVVYSDKVQVVHDDIIALMEEIASGVSFAREKINQALELDHAASFPKVDPSPIVEFHVSGLVLFHNEAATKALERAGLPDQFDRFRPKDMDLMISLFADNPGISTQYREVTIGDRVFGETITYFGEADTIRIYTMDITDKKNFEAELIGRQDELQKSNIALSRTLTMYEVLTRVNESIMKSRDRNKLLSTVCSIMTETAGYDLSFILSPPAGNEKMKILASSDPDKRYAPFVKAFLDKGYKNKNVKDSILTKKPFVCTEIGECACTADWKDEMHKPGFSVYGIFPIVSTNITTGLIAVFARDPGL